MLSARNRRGIVLHIGKSCGRRNIMSEAGNDKNNNFNVGQEIVMSSSIGMGGERNTSNENNELNFITKINILVNQNHHYIEKLNEVI